MDQSAIVPGQLISLRCAWPFIAVLWLLHLVVGSPHRPLEKSLHAAPSPLPSISPALRPNPRIPLRVGRRWVPQPGVRNAPTPTFYAPNWALYADNSGQQVAECNARSKGGACPPPVVDDEGALPPAFNTSLPKKTSSGERVQDVIQRTLYSAWGPDPPQIDLYIRAGCGAITELSYLFPTIELFWPEHLGEIVIVLDAGNDASFERFLPNTWRTTRQSYRFVYEDLPCLPGGLFNQLSYIHADVHVHGQYVVTFDSDVSLHSPVLPELLFDEHGKLLLPIARVFERDMWGHAMEAYFGAGTFGGHSMASQPVAFAVESLPAYRDWMAEKYGVPYLDTVARFELNQRPATFCWMCQVSHFIRASGRTLDLYTFVEAEDGNATDAPVYQRYALHLSYEHLSLDVNIGDNRREGKGLSTFAEDSAAAAHQGIYRVFDTELLPSCAHVNTSFVNLMSFQTGRDGIYGDRVLRFHHPHRTEPHLMSYISAFRAAEVMSRPKGWGQY